MIGVYAFWTSTGNSHGNVAGLANMEIIPRSNLSTRPQIDEPIDAADQSAAANDITNGHGIRLRKNASQVRPP
jgi:hypothetical protein